MKSQTVKNSIVLAVCFAAFAVAPFASAQSVHHVKMDERAAKADIKRLQKDRKRALKYGNWGKVAQDDRLISSDKFWIHRDMHKVQHSKG
jgi:hypothetical protein